MSMGRVELFLPSNEEDRATYTRKEKENHRSKKKTSTKGSSKKEINPSSPRLLQQPST